MNFRAEDLRAEASIGQWKDDVEILVHVAVVQQMVTVQAEKNPGTFNMAAFRKVHAPVHVFVGSVVDRARDSSTHEQAPLLKENGGD